MVKALRSRRLRTELRVDVAPTLPEPPDADHLVSPNPSPATMSRRGVLAFVGSGSLLLFVLAAGQSIGGPLRRTALLAPRGQSFGDGPNDFQVNQTAAQHHITPELTGPNWRLTLAGGASTVTLSRSQLLAMSQHTAHLPIACVEGWSTPDQAWTGVRLRDLARLAGVERPSSVLVESLQREGTFRHTVLSAAQIQNPDALLALRVNDADLSPDHGYPARVIVPANPGVRNTKWVARLTFRA
jgi:DMSO/TMAO reductase YedYZ molybdopterin-dependent catalytic subunit